MHTELGHPHLSQFENVYYTTGNWGPETTKGDTPMSCLPSILSAGSKYVVILPKTERNAVRGLENYPDIVPSSILSPWEVPQTIFRRDLFEPRRRRLR
jgi:hypothetical protein